MFSMGWGKAHAAAPVAVPALFKDNAVVSIDGQRRVLPVAMLSPEGVLLGMSFPGRLKIENQGRAMVLKQQR